MEEIGSVERTTVETGNLNRDFDRRRGDESEGEDRRVRRRYDEVDERRDIRDRPRESDRYRERDRDRDRDRDFDRYRDNDRYRDRRRDFGREPEETDRYREKGGDYRPSLAHRTADTYRDEPIRADRHRDSDSKSEA
jgi:hypothetical protein